MSCRPKNDGLHFVFVPTYEAGFLAALRRHYTGSRGPPPGRKLAVEVWEGETLRGWWGVGEPPFKLAARRTLGIDDARPLPGTVCDFVYRLESPGAVPASRILARARVVMAAEWARRYGETPTHWETLVDPARVVSGLPGYCYLRAGYRRIGETTGRGARRPPGATHGPRVWGPASRKVVLYYGPLSRR